MKRVYGLTFDVGVFLNISPDHIGPIEHPTFEDYFYHKRLLMENSRAVVVNSDMDHFEILAEEVAEQDHDFYGSQSSNQVQNSKAFSFSALASWREIMIPSSSVTSTKKMLWLRVSPAFA